MTSGPAPGGDETAAGLGQAQRQLPRLAVRDRVGAARQLALPRREPYPAAAVAAAAAEAEGDGGAAGNRPPQQECDPGLGAARDGCRAEAAAAAAARRANPRVARGLH